jgi:FkbM family methyltransferase
VTAHWSAFSSAATLARSVRLYHGDPAQKARMDALYRRFVPPGDLVFDVGAHVGDRVSSFRRLGARVVACEPQPGPARVIRLLHGGDRDVVLVEAAVGREPGTADLRINRANPTVSTLSEDFVVAADGAAGWEGQAWDATLTVPVVTLDQLIARHGLPAFVKIDVEGFEADVLAGLSHALPALSFEFTTISRAVAFACLGRIAALGTYRFDIALGESQSFTFGEPVDADAMRAHVAALPHAANSGDIYAVRQG